MIVHFMKNKGGASPTSATNYMLGKDRDRANARVLQGNPELTVAIAESLEFKHKHTVGVLSFEEENISEKAKFEIMQSFEETLLAGLDKDQYNITWIEHTDKDRLELNFIIPKVDLNSGKAMNPYFDGVDRNLVDAWKDTINYDYQLTDPKHPDKRQSHVINNDLPRDKKELSEFIAETVLRDIKSGQIQDRKDVINHIESLGLEIARETKNSISIKDPFGKQNIRLKGEIYEQDFKFDATNERTQEKRSRESEEFSRSRESNIIGVRAELERLIEKKANFNIRKFGRSAETDLSENRELAEQHKWQATSSRNQDRQEDRELREQYEQPIRERGNEDNSEYRQSNESNRNQEQSTNQDNDNIYQENFTHSSGSAGLDDNTNRNVGLYNGAKEQHNDIEPTENRVNSADRGKTNGIGRFNQESDEKTQVKGELEESKNEKRILESIRELVERVKQFARDFKETMSFISATTRTAESNQSEINEIESGISQRKSGIEKTSGFIRGISQERSIDNAEIQTRSESFESRKSRISKPLSEYGQGNSINGTDQLIESELRKEESTDRGINGVYQLIEKSLKYADKLEEQEKARESAKQRSNEQSELVRGAKSKGGMEK